VPIANTGTGIVPGSPVHFVSAFIKRRRISPTVLARAEIGDAGKLLEPGDSLECAHQRQAYPSDGAQQQQLAEQFVGRFSELRAFVRGAERRASAQARSPRARRPKQIRDGATRDEPAAEVALDLSVSMRSACRLGCATGNRDTPNWRTSDGRRLSNRSRRPGRGRMTAHASFSISSRWLDQDIAARPSAPENAFAFESWSSGSFGCGSLPA